MYCDWPLLGRCCFCMPLRRGVLTFGYINIFFSAFMIGIYSFLINYAVETNRLIYGRSLFFPSELCLALYCFELIFSGLLIYGTHKKIVLYLKMYFYYTVTTGLAVLFMQVLSLALTQPSFFHGLIETCIFTFAGLCLQIYLITLVWSLIKKMEVSGPHVYDNQLHQIVTGELKVEHNGIYNNPTVMPSDL